MDSVFVQAGAATIFVKILIDVARMIWATAPPWVFPLLALLLSPVCLLAMLALGPTIIWTQQFIAMLFLGSITCAGMATGVSAVQKKADDVRRGNP